MTFSYFLLITLFISYITIPQYVFIISQKISGQVVR